MVVSEKSNDDEEEVERISKPFDLKITQRNETDPDKYKCSVFNALKVCIVSIYQLFKLIKLISKSIKVKDEFSISDQHYYSLRKAWKLQEELPPLFHLKDMRKQYHGVFEIIKNDYGLYYSHFSSKQ